MVLAELVWAFSLDTVLINTLCPLPSGPPGSGCMLIGFAGLGSRHGTTSRALQWVRRFSGVWQVTGAHCHLILIFHKIPVLSLRRGTWYRSLIPHLKLLWVDVLEFTGFHILER